MRVFLTGGTGFLGGRIIDHLLRAGHQVVALARRPEALERREGLLPLRGDLLDRASLERGLADVDAVIHVAALVKRWVKDRSLFDKVNVEAQATLIDLALGRGLEKVLVCSSFVALGPTDRTTGDEDSLHDGRPRNDYERTKLLADRQLRQRMEKGAPLVALYPGVVYGPGRMTDGNILAAAGRDLLRGRLPGTIGPGDRRQCLAFVEDVAAGFLLALDKAEPGSRYVLGGENLTVRQALELMARAGGVEVPRRVIPYSVAGWLGRILCWQAGWTGIEPPLSPGEVEIYRHEWAYSSERARRELGYTITPAAEGLARMMRWLEERDRSPAANSPG
ncbi:MAG: NAD-dependent epimerase/dehydratase family protein [Acidobacteriota bacterium]|nr:NAD-dependent epimerase/dehydratase family protein [Acidobacteriota bacterium]